MIDTKVKVNGKTVAEYDLINETCVKKVNGEGPDSTATFPLSSGPSPFLRAIMMARVKSESTKPNRPNSSPQTFERVLPFLELKGL